MADEQTPNTAPNPAEKLDEKKPPSVPAEIAEQIADQPAPADSQPTVGKVSISALDLNELEKPGPEGPPKEMIIDKRTQRNQIITKIMLEFLTRVGFASIFLVNFAVYTFDPASYMGLIEPNAIVPESLSPEWLVKLSSFNDLFLGLLILSGWYKRWVYGWAGLWLIIFAVIRIGHVMA